MLALLESVERNGNQSQRRLAAEFGIALGLVNAYLKRCVKKGLVKVKEAPARRYTYYLTPQGFAEKSRLTIEYFSYSFSFFRRARTDCATMFASAQDKGWSRVVLAGMSDLAEISTICALETGLSIVAVVDPKAQQGRFVGLPVCPNFDGLTELFDGVVVTDLTTPRQTFDDAVERFGTERVAAPALLGVSSSRDSGESP